ncbi:MAG: LegC family aminotransferase [Desulfovibrio sp.]|jgi:aminotransferase in exopolysaccharide biosynthesis|nr:LegC family aminotransferase [Desulfovibrio sp.]
MNDFSELLRRIRLLHERPEGALPLHAPVFQGREREYVLDAVDSSFVSSVGAYVNRLEDMLQDICGVRRAVVCVNGTAALHAALFLAGVRPGDLVVTQAFSFVATANAIRHAGADPVFLDVDAETLGLSPQAVRDFLVRECGRVEGACLHKASGRRVAACVPMHTFGFPCRVQELCELCAAWGIPVVEDAAEALGSRIAGRHCGSFGLLGILSFNGNKIVTTGGGGAILTDSEALGELAKHLTTTAKRPHPWEYRHDAVAWNYRMPNLNAALGCAQLERLDEFVARKRALADRYAALFADTPWEFLREPEGSAGNYWLCSVLLRGTEERDAFLEAGNAAGVMLRPAWELLADLPMYENCPRDGLGVSRGIAARLVNLPSGVRA